MPPKQQQQQQQSEPPFKKDEKVLCFHLDLLYEAKVVDVRQSEEEDGGWLYRIHYKGWKASWDDWATQDRIRKFTPENQELAQTLLLQKRKASEKSSSRSGTTAKKGSRAAATAASEIGGSGRGSEERSAGTVTSSGRGPRRHRDYELEQEEQFHARPSIKVPVPDHIKALLVDDWENITKNQQLVPLPHAHPVSEILEDYLEHEKPQRIEGSAHVTILEETIAGLRTYFDMAIGRILLYRFERPQYREIHKIWMEASDPKHTCACDTYGPEHLARLIVNLPELIAQTNMDQQSVTRLKEELIKFANWLGKNAHKYFAPEYESPTMEYIDKARGA